MMRKILCFALSCMLMVSLTACGNAAEEQVPDSVIPSGIAEDIVAPPLEEFQSEPESLPSEQTTPNATEETIVTKMNLQVGSSAFTATLAENSSVDALVAMLQKAPIVIDMSDYSNFEKVGPLGASLPTNDEQINTEIGDIILYQGNKLVIYYAPNAWSFTRIGKIDDTTGLKDALGSGDVEVTFTLE